MSGFRKEPPPASVESLLAGPAITTDQRTRADELRARVYGHVLRVVDLDQLYQLEQCLWSELRRLDLADDDGDLSIALLTEALARVGYGSERQVSMIPDGITKDEIIAAEYDHECFMCRHEAADMEYRLSGRKCSDLHEDRELLRLDAHYASQWRKQHEESLRRFGLAEDGVP